MKRIRHASSRILRQAQNALNSPKLIVVALFLLQSVAQAQSSANSLESVGSSMWAKSQEFYRLMSVIVLLAALFFLGKGVVEALRGEQGAWVKIAGALLVFAVWVFGVPALINYMATQAKSVTVSTSW